MFSELLRVDDVRWQNALVSVQHEFYHRPEYAAFEADRIGGEPRAVWIEGAGGFFLLPLIIRPLPPELSGEGTSKCRDAISPYGYPGPLMNGWGSSPETVTIALNEAATLLSDQGIICAFVRLNPILNDPLTLGSIGHLVEHGPTYWIDLTLPMEALHQHVRSRFRSYINAAKRDGLVARWAEDLGCLSTFVSLYHETMDRVGAEDLYYVDLPYFEKLASILGRDAKLCIVEDAGGVAAAGLFSSYGEIVQYLFSGIATESSHPHASKLMMVFVRDWGKQAGKKVFHLAGGVGAQDDNLSRFKRGFSKLSNTFHTWRLITDEGAYQAAVTEWEKQSGVTADRIDGFFPAYCRPIRTAKVRKG